MKLKFLLLALVAFSFGACVSQHTCPTYMKKDNKEIGVLKEKV